MFAYIVQKRSQFSVEPIICIWNLWLRLVCLLIVTSELVSVDNSSLNHPLALGQPCLSVQDRLNDHARVPIELRIQIAKFKFHQYLPTLQQYLFHFIISNCCYPCQRGKTWFVMVCNIKPFYLCKIGLLKT